MHIDVNNAFLSWTALDLLNKGYKYDIRDSYAVIGGDEESRHGIVLAKSMKAKKLGIKTGESLYEARKKCRVLRTYPPNYMWYQEKSNQLFKLLSNYSPDIEIASIDECYLDYEKVKGLYGDEVEFAYKLKDEIKNKLGFTVNIGIGNNKLCAKMASDFLKPDRVHTLYLEEVKDKMWPLPIGKLFGVGKSSEKKLLALGINTIGDLAKTDVKRLYPYFKNQSQRLINHANGLSSDLVISTKPERKGISNSTTLSKDLVTISEIEKVLYQLCENVSVSLRRKKKYTSVIAVQLKDKYFKNYTHQRRLNNPTNITSEIYQVSCELLREMWDRKPVRLVGIRLDNLSNYANHQVSLFESLDEREQSNKLDYVVDEIKAKYGSKIIKKASLTDKKINKKYEE